MKKTLFLLSIFIYLPLLPMLTCINENFPGLSIIGSSSSDYMSSICACLSQGRFLGGSTCPGCPKWNNAINTPAKESPPSSSGFFFAHCSAKGGGFGTNIYINTTEIKELLKKGSNKYTYDGTQQAT